MASWDDRERAFEERPLRTTIKWGIGIGLVITLLMLVTIPLGWGFAWLNEGARITGVQNVRDQSTEIIGDYTSLQATAGNVCDAKGDAHSGVDPQLVGGSAGQAYRQTYRRIEADYDRRMANLFEARLIHRFPSLSSYPRVAPTLSQMQAQVC